MLSALRSRFAKAVSPRPLLVATLLALAGTPAGWTVALAQQPAADAAGLSTGAGTPAAGKLPQRGTADAATVPVADDTAPTGPQVDDEIGLIEAPSNHGTIVPEGAFALAPERLPQAAARDRSAPMGSPPVVVELFTAQGCSTCPPADELIATLADLPEVLTLSWHVDYWDYLGWPDGFASPANTARQQGYATVAGERGVYTPQIVVDGQDTLLGVGRAGLLALIDEHAARPAAIMVTSRVDGANHVIDLTPRAAIPGGVQVTLVRYLPRRDVRVTEGENRGMRLRYRNIVVGVELLTQWPARAPLRLTVRSAAGEQGGYPADTRHAILVQQVLRGGLPGPILAALRLDP